MTPERWQQVDQLFHSALERVSSERVAFLTQACDGDETLRQEVESLIAYHDQSASFIEAPASDIAAEVLAGTEDRLTAGQPIGHYQILSLLDEGGMGEVYLAQDRRLGRQVALKRLPAQFTFDPEQVSRFEQEARAASSLNHPNIVTIHEIGHANSSHFITTEFIDGETLRHHLTSTQMEIEELLDIAGQVASALAAAHAVGIVHRDIKPENIMIRRDGYVKVLDFGLAKLVEPKDKCFISSADSTAPQNQTGKGMILGTVNYMSPEQAKGEQVDERTDIFSFGVLIYEMIAGRTPFAGNSRSETFANLINQAPRPLSLFAANVPDELQGIVSGMLVKDKDDRYQTMKDLISSLSTFREHFLAEKKLEESDRREINNQTRKITDATSRETKQILLTDWNPTFPLKHHRKKLISGFCAALIALILSAGFYRFSRSGNVSESFRQIRLSRLTSIGNVGNFALSPDGNLLAYEAKEKEGVSLWVRQIEMTNSIINLVPLKKGNITFLTFSPDGKLVYYGFFSGYGSTAELYSVPALGGASQKIPTNTPNFMSFSPDGKHYAQVVSNLAAGEKALVINSLNSKEEIRLAVRKTPNSFNILGQFCAWSPDGKTIAVISNDTGADGQFSTVVGVSAADGSERLLSAKRWNELNSVQWLKDGRGLFVLGADTQQAPSQIWFVSATDGEARKLTHDLNDYSYIGVTPNGKQIISVQESRTSNISVGTVGRNSNDFRELLAETGTLDTIVSTANGIIFRSNADGKANLWMVGADGSGRSQITVDAEIDERGLCSTPDAKQIVFPSRKAGKINLWSVGVNAGPARQLTHGDGEFFPACMPDNRGVIYQKGAAYGIKSTLWRISLDGGKPIQLTDYYAIRPALSPDGRRVAFFHITNEKWSIGIVSSDGGRIEQDIALPEGVLDRLLRWSPDGQSLFYIANEGNVGNVWSLPLNGQSPKQVTKFNSQLLADFVPTQQEKGAVVTRTVKLRDVVIISEE